MAPGPLTACGWTRVKVVVELLMVRLPTKVATALVAAMAVKARAPGAIRAAAAPPPPAVTS